MSFVWNYTGDIYGKAHTGELVLSGINDTYIPRKLCTTQRTSAEIDSLTIHDSNLEVLDFFYRKIGNLVLINNPHLKTVRGYWWQDTQVQNVTISGNPQLQTGKSQLNNSVINRTTDLYTRLDAQSGWIWSYSIETLVIDGPVYNDFL